MIAQTLLQNLAALCGGLFLIATFGMVATRQMGGCLRFFIFQSGALAASALLLGLSTVAWHLMVVCAITLISKAWLFPLILRRIVGSQITMRREVTQAVNVPASLLLALGLAVSAIFLAARLVASVNADAMVLINLPIGLAGLFIAAYTIVSRRDALPQLLGLLAMENSAFFAGIAIAPEMPLIAELAIAFDVLIFAFISGVLTRRLVERLGTTRAGMLSSLREESPP